MLPGEARGGSLKLRAYRAGDVAAMYALDLECFAEEFRFDAKAMRRFAEAKGALVVVAERDAVMVGFCIVQIERRRSAARGYVVTLDVAPEERRTGVAGRLMEEVERQAAEGGAGWMELHVHAGNGGAIRFYEGRGYLRVGEVAGFYGKGLDALVYLRKLGAAKVEAVI